MARIPQRIVRHLRGVFTVWAGGCRHVRRFRCARLGLSFVPVLLVMWAGCTTPPTAGPGGAPFLPGENPIFVPEVDREFLWNQLVDAIDDDFRIERERRMQVIGGVITEGMIETFPTTGSSMLEPWRGDAASWFQRSYASLQSIRRQATVRVTPVPGGYSVAMVVTIELEDMGKPELATTGSIHLQHDSSIPREQAGRYTAAGTIGWIPMGRDTALEQKLLSDIRDRVSSAPAPVAPAAPPAAWTPR